MMKKKVYKKMSFNVQMGEKYMRKYYNKPSPKKRRFFRKQLIVLQEKIIANARHVDK